jgi:endonuclease YncB( thermonuclease family)
MQSTGRGCLLWVIGIVAGIALVISAVSGDDESPDVGSRTPDRSGDNRGVASAGGERDQRRDQNRDRDRNGDRDRGRGDADRDQEAANARAPGIPEGARRTTVTGVTDGDTVDLAGLGSSRLIGVDTPETYSGPECYGARASAFTGERLAPGTTVYYLRGPEPVDQYGRDLVYVWLSDGTFFNALLVREGFAVPLTIPPNTDYAGRFRRLSAEARDAQRGLWSPSACGGNANEPAATGGGSSGGQALGGTRAGGCEPGYDPCVPAYPPDVDCADVDGPITVTGSDPHALDGNGDGLGCEA